MLCVCTCLGVVLYLFLGGGCFGLLFGVRCGPCVSCLCVIVIVIDRCRRLVISSRSRRVRVFPRETLRPYSRSSFHRPHRFLCFTLPPPALGATHARNGCRVC